MLTHYTDSIEALEGILANGFAWVPNRRDLMPFLVPEHDFSRREPQQFGMISFTELEPEYTSSHTEDFGPFGVVVSEEWARANRAERVIYVQNEGPAYEAWRSLFTVGYRDLRSRIKYPDDAGWLMSFENKAAAGAVAGAAIWATLLQLYEYMESADFSCECEWRIVHPDPYYSLSQSKNEVIRQVSPPQGWAQRLNVLPVSRRNVEGFVCPRNEYDRLLDSLPDGYQDFTVFKTED